MLIAPFMPTFDVAMSNFTNGDVNTYTVTMYSPLPHFTGDVIKFQFPSQVILPPIVVCIPVAALTQIDCSKISSSTVSGVMTFASDFNEVGVMIEFQVL